MKLFLYLEIHRSEYSLRIKSDKKNPIDIEKQGMLNIRNKISIPKEHKY